MRTLALFDGLDSSGLGLWVTNGTAAGTHELTGIAGANASGLNASDITPLIGVGTSHAVDFA